MNLTPNELLTTTRSVRKRLDLKRAVEREVIEECLAVAQQAPTASNMQNWHFLMITDSTKRARLSELYRKGWEIYSKLPTSASSAKYEDAARMATQARVASSAKFLADHLHEVPVHVIPCIDGRTDNQPTVFQSAQWGTIAPACWSFILAARTRGLGAVWTCMHLY
ncbi:MAG: nitroreductase family protein, partial [Candidatus Bathyarchaeia archaeon]